MNSPSPEQQAIIDTWGKGMAVMAGAGSGKTTTLVAKCRKLIEIQPQARFIAVSFTERSASDLKEKLSQSLTQLAELGVAGVLHQNWITTIHGLCGSVIREFPREAGFDGEETVLSESESIALWERAIEVLWTEELPHDVEISFEELLLRESQSSLMGLMKRIRDLSTFGVLKFLGDTEDRSSSSLKILSEYVIDRYERLKRRQGVIDFNDLEKGAYRALEINSVRQAYHKRFELVLVDEFQDTNPIQAQIILRLARPDLSNLCVVGDPKQSIYRFRDADVSVFEDFCSKMPVQLSLTWNFRSRPGIIEFANSVCEKAFQASDMRFDALIPKREPRSDLTPVIRFDVQNPIDLGKWILHEVSKGIPLHEMALLVRKVRGNEKWFKALTSCGIPIAVGSGGLFWEDPRVRELVAFLKWWDNPGNSLSGAIFLRSPWVGISDLELDRWSKMDSTWRNPFFESDHPIAKQLRALTHQVVRPGELLMALLVDQKTEDEIAAPLLGLWHRVEDYSSKGLDFHSVVVEVSSAIDESRREREVPAPRNLGQLSVLTFHGAKGLEFSHVILIDFGDKTRAPDMPLLFWDRNKGTFLAQRDADGERDRTHPMEAQWRELEQQKGLAESKRLFYVALTRARERLVLVCPTLKKEDIEFDSSKVFHSDHWRGWLECSGVQLPEATLSGSSLSAPTLQTDLNQNRIEIVQTFPKEGQTWARARHSVTEWTLLSRCPRAYEWAFIRPVSVAEGLPEAGIFTGEKVSTWLESEITQQELGSRVHSCLERGDFDSLNEIEKQVGSSRFLAAPVISWAFSSPWMAPSNEQKNRTVWTELSFEVPFQNEVLVGSIDRLVADESSEHPRYSIIDFKVSERPKSVSTLLYSYQTQLDLYAWAMTAMDNRITLDSIEAALVHISAQTVQVVPVTLGKTDINQVIESSLQIIKGEPGKPRPGLQCRYCEFRSQCDEGQQWYEKNQ